jgi:hypothetical protein
MVKKIRWFVAQDQSGIREELPCISAPVCSVPSSWNKAEVATERVSGSHATPRVTESRGPREKLGMALHLRPEQPMAFAGQRFDTWLGPRSAISWSRCSPLPSLSSRFRTAHEPTHCTAASDEGRVLDQSQALDSC